MNHLVFALTAPADRSVFTRISTAYDNFEAWCADLREKKIDVQHELAVRVRLNAMESELARWEAVKGEIATGVRGEHTARALRTLLAQHLSNEVYAAIRSQRIYFRVLLLNLLNQEDAWQIEQDAKAAAKAAKVSA